MKTRIFESEEEISRGLQFMEPIPADTLFVFPGVPERAHFHSENVREPFDLAFVSEDDRVLYLQTLYPPHATATAPAGTAYAVESKAGILTRRGLGAGNMLPMGAL